MNNSPLVSIGVPVYNGEPFLARTLTSLLTQTYTNLDVIICDNASTDRTAEISRGFVERDARVRYTRNDANIGPTPNFLRTLGMATGKYFTWTAADDVRPIGSIEQCVAALEQNDQLVMAHGPIELDFPKSGTTVRIDNHMALQGGDAAERVRVFTSALQHVGMLFGLHRREVLTTIRYGNHVGGDYFVCLLMCQRGPVAWLPTPILTYRHVYGAPDNPMYVLEPLTARDLLIHRGLKRKKCWMVLGIGSYYLWRHGAADGFAARLQSVWCYARAFMTRFPRHLATEAVFLCFTPLSWVAAPLAPLGRRFKRVLREAPSATR